jgi:hypothetical protein
MPRAGHYLAQHLYTRGPSNKPKRHFRVSLRVTPSASRGRPNGWAGAWMCTPVREALI